MSFTSRISGTLSALPQPLLPTLGLLSFGAAALALPGGAVLALGLGLAAGLGTLVAGLRRHGGRDVPALPVVLED